MRIVFDTNILVSAVIFPGKQAHLALDRIIESDDELLLSKPILDELLGVLARRFSRDREELSRLALWLADVATWVNPTLRIRALEDEPDNRILECAVTGDAAQIVTGDKEFLRLGSFRGVAIVTLRDYLS